MQHGAQGEGEISFALTFFWQDLQHVKRNFFCSILPFLNSSLKSLIFNADSLHTLLPCQSESECLFPEDLWSRERTYLAFGTHFGAERGLKTMDHSLIVLNNIYISIIL